MSNTTLSKIFPKLDKICDATFIRKVVGTTKKDAVVFFTDNQECRRFFENKEAEIDRHNELVQNDIRDFLSQETMKYEIAKFKAVIKEKQAKEKASRRELEKQAIIEEYLRQQEKQKQEAEDRAKLGMPPSTSPSSGSKTIIKPKVSTIHPVSSTTSSAPVAVVATPVQQLETLSSSSEEVATNMASTTKSNVDGTDSSEETVLNLDDFFQMFQAVYDQGHIVFKYGTKSVKAQIELDNDTQKIVVKLKTSPTISIKK